MKIALIIERVDISLGGAERSIAELACALQARGLNVTVLAAKGDSGPDNVRVLCKDDPGKRAPYAAFARALQDHLRQGSYDIVHSTLPFDFAHVYQPRGGSYAETIVRHAASYEKTWVAGLKRITAFTNRRRQLLKQAESALCRKTPGPMLAALSQYVADQFKQHYQLSPERIALIRNGINAQRPINQAAVDQLRKRFWAALKLEDPHHGILCLFAAHNFRLKGLAPLLRALAALRQNNPECPCHLIVAGRGDASPYSRLGQRLGLERRIAFVGAIDGMQNALSLADVAVLPTFYDPASRFILEALAHNTPVITTRFNGATDLFADHRHGRIIDSPTHINALAQALAHMSYPGTLSKMKTAIIEDNIVEKVSIDRAATQLIELYRSILQKKGQD